MGEFAVFLELHSPPACVLSRPSNYAKEVLAVAKQHGEGDLEKAKDVSSQHQRSESSHPLPSMRKFKRCLRKAL